MRNRILLDHHDDKATDRSRSRAPSDVTVVASTGREFRGGRSAGDRRRRDALQNKQRYGRQGTGGQ